MTTTDHITGNKGSLLEDHCPFLLALSLRMYTTQVIHTSNGSKFVRGETVVTVDGIKLMAG